MGGRSKNVLQVVTGWEAVELVFMCVGLGLWQLMKISAKRLWKGHRRKVDLNPSVEFMVDSSVGTHCFIKVMGVKYHIVKTGPRSGRPVLVLRDAPDTASQSAHWSQAVQTLAEHGWYVVTLDLRGTGGSEVGSRRALTPPRVVDELSALLTAFGVTENNPAVAVGFGIGGMLTWYLAHCHGRLISKFAVIDAPHPNLYWQYSPAEFCKNALHFMQWPYFPEQWLAENALKEGRENCSRPCDWTGPLHYVRGAAWWRIRPSHRIECPALLIGTKESAAQLVTSATHCLNATIRIVATQNEKMATITEFLIVKDTSPDEPRTLVGRMLGAVAGRGRELTAKLSQADLVSGGLFKRPGGEHSTGKKLM